MSRLDSLLRRLVAQRACLAEGVRLIAGIPGPLLELGLGHGRTYDHLRHACPDRPIFVFERTVSRAAARLVPPQRLILGDFRATIPAARERTGAPAALAHCDVGSGDARRDHALASWLGDALLPSLRAGAVVICDQPMAASSLQPLTPPGAIESERYFMYRLDRDPGGAGRRHR